MTAKNGSQHVLRFELVKWKSNGVTWLCHI